MSGITLTCNKYEKANTVAKGLKEALQTLKQVNTRQCDTGNRRGLHRRGYNKHKEEGTPFPACIEMQVQSYRAKTKTGFETSREKSKKDWLTKSKKNLRQKKQLLR